MLFNECGKFPLVRVRHCSVVRCKIVTVSVAAHCTLGVVCEHGGGSGGLNGRTFLIPLEELLSDEYANHIPHPVPNPKYTKVKVPHTNTVSAEQLCRTMLLLPLPYKKPCCC